MTINKFVGVGNLTREPELRRTQSGMAVLNFGIAVNNRRKNAQGDWEDDPCFLDCAMFGNRAEAVSNYLSKGAKCAVEGRLRTEAWQAKDGGKRSKVSLVVDEIEFMSRNDGSHQGQVSQPMNQGGMYQASTSTAGPEIEMGVYDEDIPFGG